MTARKGPRPAGAPARGSDSSGAAPPTGGRWQEEGVRTRCAALHGLARRGTKHSFPFDRARLPLNGIYVLFETGEEAHGGDRIVRVGTHTGDDQLPARLTQHFVNEDKDRSIFRKNIGRALLNKAADPFLAEWELDRTSRAARERHGVERQSARRRAVEYDVTKYLQGHFRFAVFRVDDKSDRLTLESSNFRRRSSNGRAASADNRLN